MKNIYTKPIFFLILLMITLLVSTPNISAQHELLRKEIDKIVRFDTEIPYDDHPGYIVGIIDNDSTYILNFGQEEIDTLDIFELGGLSKVFTADLILSLAQKGMINIDDSINKFFPSDFQNEHLAHCTVSDLLMHQVEFPKRPSNLSKKEIDITNPYAYYTKEDLLQYYKSFIPPRKNKWSGKVLNYSHINYALLEIIVEAKTKMPYEVALQKHLLKKMGLNYTSSCVDPEKITSGYDRASRISNIWDFQSFTASEGLRSNLHDLLLFMKYNLGIASNPMPQVITESLLKQKSSNIDKRLWHSYAWYILTSRKRGDIFTHTGTTGGHKVYMHFLPRTKTGVIILSKSAEGTGELGMLILRLVNYNWKRK